MKRELILKCYANQRTRSSCPNMITAEETTFNLIMMLAFNESFCDLPWLPKVYNIEYFIGLK